LRCLIAAALAKLMAELGWTAARVRDLTRGGYKEQIRGYCAIAAVVQATFAKVKR
jgi:hypothetical protein